MDFDFNEFAKVVEEHILLEKRLSGGSQDETPKADIVTDGILRKESVAGASSSSASSTCSRHTELHAYGNSTSASAFLGPASGTSSDPMFRHSRGESCLSAGSNSLSGFAVVTSPKSNTNTNSNGFVGGCSAPCPASSLAVTAAPFAPPLSSPSPSTTPPSNSQTSRLAASVMQYHTPAHVAVVNNNTNNIANTNVAPFIPQQHPFGADAFCEAANLPDVKAVPLRMDRRSMHSYESTAGIFVGQLPVLYSPADVVQLLCAVGAECGVDVQVKDVKMHPRNTCAFVDVNAESVPFLTKYNRMILCDVNTLWMTTNPSRLADLLGVAERCCNRNLSGVPRTTLVLEPSTRDPFTGRRQRPNNNNTTNAHANNTINGAMNGNRHNSNTNYGGLGNFNQNANSNNFHPTNNTKNYMSGFVDVSQQNTQHQIQVSPSSAAMPMSAMMMKIQGPTEANNGSLLQQPPRQQQQQQQQRQHNHGSGFHVLHPQQQHGLTQYTINGSAALSFINNTNNSAVAVPLNQMLMMGVPTGTVDANGNIIIIPHYTADANGNAMNRKNNNNEAANNTNSMMMVFPMVANMDGSSTSCPADPRTGRITSIPSFSVFSSALASNNTNKHRQQQPAATPNNNKNSNTLPPPSYAPMGAAPLPAEHSKGGNMQQQQQHHQIPHCSTCRIPYVAGLVNAAVIPKKSSPSATAATIGVGCALCFFTIPDKTIAHSCGNCHTHICLKCMRGVVESSAQQ